MSIDSKLADINIYFSTHLTFVLETVVSTMYFWGYNTTFMGGGSIKAIKDKTRPSIYSTSDIKPEMLPTNMLEKLDIQINQKPETIKDYILKMGLITFFSLFEAFNKDYFQELYCSKPYLMKSKKKEVNMEYLLEFTNMEDLHRSLSLKEIEGFGYLNIDEIAALLFKKFKIDLKKDLKCWSNLRESYYRRNLIVHTDGKVSKTYREKCSLGKNQLDQVLPCDIEYVWKCHDNLRSYIDFINDSIRQKFHLKSRFNSI